MLAQSSVYYKSALMDVFAVIADPMRRAMLVMMLSGERPAGEFVAAFPKVSQPAISQHLKVLRDAGMVTVRADRQRRFYSLQADALTSIRDWLSNFMPTVVPEPIPAPVAEQEIVVEPAPKPKKASKPKAPSKPAPAPEPITLDLFG